MGEFQDQVLKGNFNQQYCNNVSFDEVLFQKD